MFYVCIYEFSMYYKKNLDFRYNKEFGTVGTFFGREVNKKQGHRKIE